MTELKLQLNDADRQALSRVPLFRAVNDDTLAALVANATIVELPAGTRLFNREDLPQHFFVVLEGWVKVFRDTADGEEAVFGVFTRGESLAEAAAFLGKGYPASAEVVEEARLLRIVTTDFVNHMRRQPEIAISMLGSMSLHLHRLVRDVEQLQTQSATQRVMEFILERCEVNDGATEVALPYDKTLLARRLGMKPESLSRIWSRLRKHGVDARHDRVLIDDVARLRRESSQGRGKAGGALH